MNRGKRLQEADWASHQPIIIAALFRFCNTPRQAVEAAFRPQVGEHALSL